MLTTGYSDDKDPVNGTTFHHNGDFSGNVVIVRKSPAAQATIHHRDHTTSFEVPYEHLEKLVLDKLRRDMVAKLENASYPQLRKLFFQ